MIYERPEKTILDLSVVVRGSSSLVILSDDY
jgi:hypothetical protein